jgi:hypothetical protein
MIAAGFKRYRLLSHVRTLKRRNQTCICGLITCVSNCPAQTAHEWNAVKSSDFLAPYLGSPWDHIDFMLDFSGFKPGDSVLDLGAGNGKILYDRTHHSYCDTRVLKEMDGF